jgi:hypothetical protein
MLKIVQRKRCMTDAEDYVNAELLREVDFGYGHAG